MKILHMRFGFGLTTFNKTRGNKMVSYYQSSEKFPQVTFQKYYIWDNESNSFCAQVTFWTELVCQIRNLSISTFI